MSKQIGGGLPKLWQFPDNHRFQPAFVLHDASQDAIEIFLCNAKLSDYLTDDYPTNYIVFIETELLALNTIFRNQAFNKKDAVRLYVGRSDNRFKEMVNKLARNKWEKFQAKLYASIVNLYSSFKYS